MSENVYYGGQYLGSTQTPTPEEKSELSTTTLTPWVPRVTGYLMCIAGIDLFLWGAMGISSLVDFYLNLWYHVKQALFKKFNRYNDFRNPHNNSYRIIMVLF